MEAKKVKMIAALVMAVLLILVIIIIWHSLKVSKATFILTGVCVSLIFSIFIWVVIQYICIDSRQALVTKQADSEGTELRIQYSFLRKVAGLPTSFQYKILETATDNFQVLIGRGSSASVFKGILDNGTPIAVKRIEDSDHSDRDFRSEVTAIGRVQHVNLVHLLGYCIVPRSRVRFLVYEFVCNESLDKWIFPPKGPQSDRVKCLPWPLRYRVAVDVAKALAYLHQDCRARVLHLDVKPENILLDESFRALVSDFGLSKMMGKDESRIVMTIRGTRGYLAPEWFVGCGVSEKCDIFSYGMVLLEIVAGRRSLRLARERQWSYLPRIAMEKVKQGKTMEVVDERLLRGGEVEEKEVKTLVYVALWCVREEAKLRPSMAQVVEMLQGRTRVEAPPPEEDMLILDLLNIEYSSSAAAVGGGGGGVVTRALHHLECPTLGASAYFCTSSVLSGR